MALFGRSLEAAVTMDPASEVLLVMDTEVPRIPTRVF
jgi:hypothetical protein